MQSLGYDAFDLVSEETIAQGSYALTYDSTSQITTVLDRSGTTTKYTSDAYGTITRKEVLTKGLRPGEPASFITTHEVDPATKLVTATVWPKGNRTEYVYDSNPEHHEADREGDEHGPAECNRHCLHLCLRRRVFAADAVHRSQWERDHLLG